MTKLWVRGRIIKGGDLEDDIIRVDRRHGKKDIKDGRGMKRVFLLVCADLRQSKHNFKL